MPSLGWQLVLLLTAPLGGTLALDLPPGHPRDAHVCLASGADHLGMTSPIRASVGTLVNACHGLRPMGPPGHAQVSRGVRGRARVSPNSRRARYARRAPRSAHP